MSLFDPIFFTIFQYYKPKYKAKANGIALFYMLFLQASLLMLAGLFLILFFNQLNRLLLTTTKAWTIWIIGCIVLLFRNWIYYTGKKRKILNTKSNKNSSSTNIYVLWLIPFACIGLSILLMQRL